MVYTIRNINKKTKDTIAEYAYEHQLTMGTAMQALIDLGIEYYEKTKHEKKKYKNTLAALENLRGNYVLTHNCLLD